ncbi:hypothetical protein BHE74_00050804 [Ensete ventricosum]|nr:hypothetical protein GW17_00022900 [Ensete ventricosum]RWW43517.1 hypothetical protein BHE74_00050804 [Ensete ventricosum]
MYRSKDTERESERSACDYQSDVCGGRRVVLAHVESLTCGRGGGDGAKIKRRGGGWRSLEERRLRRAYVRHVITCKWGPLHAEMEKGLRARL